MELFFDTETSGMYKFKKPFDDPSQPWIVQIGFILSDRDIIYQEGNLLIHADKRSIEPDAESVHHISAKDSERSGLPEPLVMEVMMQLLRSADLIVCHNIGFDVKVLASNMSKYYHKLPDKITNSKFHYCTMIKGTPLCKLPGKFGNYKWPKLQELYMHLFGLELLGAHDALTDARATMSCYYEMTKEERK